jgi:hypothetical protein
MNHLTQTSDTTEGNIEWNVNGIDHATITIVKYPVFLDPSVISASDTHSVVTKPYTLSKPSLLDHAIQQQNNVRSTSTSMSLSLQSSFDDLCKKHGLRHHLHIHDIQRFFETRTRETQLQQQEFLLQQTEIYQDMERIQKTVEGLLSSKTPNHNQLQVMNEKLTTLKQLLAAEELKLAELTPNDLHDAMFRACVHKINFLIQSHRRSDRKTGYDVIFMS